MKRLVYAGGRYIAESTQVLVGYETSDFDDFAETERLSVDIKHVASLELMYEEVDEDALAYTGDQFTVEFTYRR